LLSSEGSSIEVTIENPKNLRIGMYSGRFDPAGEMFHLQDFGIFDVETCAKIENCAVDGDYMKLTVD